MIVKQTTLYQKPLGTKWNLKNCCIEFSIKIFFSSPIKIFFSSPIKIFFRDVKNEKSKMKNEKSKMKNQKSKIKNEKLD